MSVLRGRKRIHADNAAKCRDYRERKMLSEGPCYCAAVSPEDGARLRREAWNMVRAMGGTSP